MGTKEMDKDIDYAALQKKMLEEYEFLYKEIYEFNSYNCEEGEMNGRIVLDVGANTGYFAIYAVMNGAKKVYCFEPNQENFKRLLERTKDFDNIIAINKAVQKPGVKKVSLVNNDNKALSIEENGVRTEVRASDDGEIDCISLEEILSNINERVILKTDCEGSEYDMFLNSSKETLQKIDLIYSEIHNGLHPNADYNVTMLSDFIVNNGFESIECISRWITGYWNGGVFTPNTSVGENGSENYYRKFVRIDKHESKNKKAKIYDCFPFFNELDLLEIRLEELYDVVDVFVISEANATHSGHPKPLYLQENISRFEKWRDKMVLRTVDLLSNLPRFDGINPNWTREHLQRNDAMEYLRLVCDDNDFVIVSDADEIPRVSAINEFIKWNHEGKDATHESAGVLVQDRYMYYFNYRNVTTDEPQLNSKIVRYGMLKEYNLFDMNGIRYCDKENLMPTYCIENGGWHFTFMGGLEKVIEKVKAFAHQEYNVPEKINAERMLENFNEGKDVYDAKTTWETVEIDDSFPKKIKDQKDLYTQRNFIKEVRKATKMEIYPRADKVNVFVKRDDNPEPLQINLPLGCEIVGEESPEYKITYEKTGMAATFIPLEKKTMKIELHPKARGEGKEILCMISTRGRYETTLPMAIMSVILQTKLPDELRIYDDNDDPKNLTEIQHYRYLFQTLDEKGVKWQVIFGQKKGQHYNHQHANTSEFKYVWRLDDDTVAEPDVLEKLYDLFTISPDVGAVGGSILTPPFQKGIKADGKIENIRSEPNLQWDCIKETMEVDHLHCSYLYRAGIEDFNLNLSKVAHREESLHSYGIKKKGHRIFIVPCITWHYKNNEGGIRSHNNAELYEHDEKIFQSFLELWDVKATSNKICVLDNGLGDHYAFKNILPELRLKHKKIIVAACYPDIFFDEPDIELISIQQAKNMMNISAHNIYVRMDEWKWNKSLTEAFRKLYLS